MTASQLSALSDYMNGTPGSCTHQLNVLFLQDGTCPTKTGLWIFVIVIPKEGLAATSSNKPSGITHNTDYAVWVIEVKF